MRSKQNYRQKVTREQNNTSQFENKELFSSTNSDLSESDSSYSDSSGSESSTKNKNVSSLCAIFRICRVLSNLFFYLSYHNRQTQ